MLNHQLPYLANCSLLFTERPLLERPALVREAGFDAIEFWWPFAQAVPPDRDVDAFVAAVADSGVRLVGLNFFAGDLAGPDCGGRLGVGVFNALCGNRIDGLDPREQDELGTQNPVLAAAAAARSIDASVLVESVSGPTPCPLGTAADVPGRGEPGSGTLPIDRTWTPCTRRGFGAGSAWSTGPRSTSSTAWTGCPANTADAAHRRRRQGTPGVTRPRMIGDLFASRRALTRRGENNVRGCAWMAP